MTDKRYTKDGEYLSKAAVFDLNERHGWMEFGDSQSDVSNAFANNAVHSFLDSAKQAQEVLGETGLTPRHLVEQRDALYEALRRLTREYVFTRTMDGTSAQDCENMECVSSARTALALVKGEPK